MGDMLDNEVAFLSLLRWSEGTDQAPDPYRVCYGFKHTIESLADHPSITGEWMGERLTDEMCAKVGLAPGCVSTAAGAYQFIRPTWRGIRDHLRLPSFEPEFQDRAALYLIANRGALEDVHAGRIQTAIMKCSTEWASLPGNFAGQPQRRQDDLLAAFEGAGGTLA